MKKILVGCMAALTFSAVQAADYAVVDLDKVVQSSVYLQQQEAALKKTIQPKTTQIENIKKTLASIQQKGQAAKTDAEREKLYKELQTNATQATQLEKEVQIAVQNSMQTTNQTFSSRIKTVAEQLRQEQKLDLVLNKSSVLAYDVKTDLTDKMIQKVNAIK